MKKEDFLKKINEKQRKFDYSLLPKEFRRKEKIEVICHEKDALGREHGVFETIGDHFIGRGDGCPKCNGKYMDNELFVFQSKQIHGEDAYDYSKFDFVNKNTKSIIHCNKHNIDFEQQARKHLSGHGCPLCRYDKSGDKRRVGLDKFVTRAKLIWGEKYDYSECEYSTCSDKVKIICHKTYEDGTEHGPFMMTPLSHTNNGKPQGCPICGRIKCSESRRYTPERFEALANERHKNKYIYHQDYVSTSTKVRITCKKHGDFFMTPGNHLIGQGCPRCALVYTTPEVELKELLISILGKEEEIIIHDKKTISPLELDIYIPRRNIAIEYDGLVWHSEKFADNYKTRHLDKTNLCNEKGIRLIHIFEDEWLYRKEIVVSRLKAIFGVFDETIYARQCSVEKISNKEANEFMEENHLQGKCKSEISYGLKKDGKTVSAMIFGKPRQTRKYNDDYGNTYELLRFASLKGVRVVGGASKMLKRFVKEKRPHTILSYADKRWSDGKLYESIGFEHTHDCKPNYFYVDGKRRLNRFGFRKASLVKEGFDNEKSEREIMTERGLYRIYDCGTMVFRKQIRTDS